MDIIEGAGWIGLSESERATMRQTSQDFDVRYLISGPTKESVEVRGKEFIEDCGYGYGGRVGKPYEADGKWCCTASRYASCD